MSGRWREKSEEKGEVMGRREGEAESQRNMGQNDRGGYRQMGSLGRPQHPGASQPSRALPVLPAVHITVNFGRGKKRQIFKMSENLTNCQLSKWTIP